MGGARHQAQEERAGREEQRDGGAELCRGEQSQDPGPAGGEGGGAAAEAEEAAGELPPHHGRSRQVSTEIPGGGGAGQTGGFYEGKVQVISGCEAGSNRSWPD